MPCGSPRRAWRAMETPTYRRSEAFAVVRAECQAVRAPVGLYETTNYGKYEVTGRGARAWLDRVFACRIPKPDGSRSRRCSTPPAASSATCRSPASRDDRFLIVGSGFAEEFHLRWFWLAEPPRGRPGALGGLDARRLLHRRPASRASCSQRLTRIDLSAAAFRLFSVMRDRGRLRTGDPDARRLHR